MKKVYAGVIGSIVLGLILFVLFSNKAQMEKEAKIAVITSYPVSVTKVERKRVDINISQVGVINANNNIPVVSELSGKVVAVMVKEGAHVSAGTPLVRVEDLLPRTNLTVVRTNFAKAKKDLERYQALHADGLISDSQLESMRLNYESASAQLVEAQRQYSNSVVRSPISGVIAKRPANLGMMVNLGTVIANVVDTSRFKVEVKVGEETAFKLRVGDPVSIETEVYPGVQLQGRIENIGIAADAAHTYPVEVIIPVDSRYPLKDGMFGKVTFNTVSKESLIIPRKALVGSIKKPQVYTVQNGVAKLRNLVIEEEAGENLLVKTGLQEGETIVISGQNNLRDNIKVEIVR
jgi:RND family efflux transporter MFP subunit